MIRQCESSADHLVHAAEVDVDGPVRSLCGAPIKVLTMRSPWHGEIPLVCPDCEALVAMRHA